MRRVGELRSRVEAITGALLDQLAEDVDRCPGPVELVERFCYPLPITVICELVGIPESDRPAWRAWGRELVSMDPTRMPPAYRAMVAGIRKLIGIRRETPAEDLLSALIRAHDTEHGRLSDQELVTFVVTLVLAGHETTAHLIGNSVVALLGHPDQLALAARAAGALATSGARAGAHLWDGVDRRPALRLAGHGVRRGVATGLPVVSSEKTTTHRICAGQA